MECLYWRRGALFYMYCHTLFNDNERRHLNRVHLMEVWAKRDNLTITLKFCYCTFDGIVIPSERVRENRSYKSKF